MLSQVKGILEYQTHWRRDQLTIINMKASHSQYRCTVENF